MTTHPAALMLRVWLGCVALFLILPFHLFGREVSVYGFAVLALFLASFIAGSLFGAPIAAGIPAPLTRAIDFRRVDRLLVPAAAIATVALLLDLAQHGFLDLSASFVERNNRATALVTGSDQGGGIFFQIGFLLFPASYVYAVRTIAFERRITLWKLGLLGFLPPVLTGLTTGGRGSLLYALVIALLALRARRRIPGRSAEAQARRGGGWNPLLVLFLVVAGLVSLNYFVQVFIVRVEGFGGVENAMDHAARDWGVSFEGDRAAIMRNLLGDGNTYLIFIFAWYIVQGLVISNEIFSFYNGVPALGIYGIDLVTAFARRFNGDAVADRLFGLLDLNIYGFLPSAFGSFFVDFRFWSIPLFFLWGYLAGLVYRLTNRSGDPRWMLAAPFVTMGILFSVLNTPLGFNNGFVTHLWLVVALLASRTTPDKAAALPGERAPA